MKPSLPILDCILKSSPPPTSSSCLFLIITREGAEQSCLSFKNNIYSWKCSRACTTGISKQAVIMFLCLSHCFLISPGYKCGGSTWIFQEQTAFYLVRPTFFTFGISLRSWIKPRLWYGRNIIRIVGAISIFLCNHPQFHECIIQLFVGNEAFSIPEVICSYANNRDLLCLWEENIYRSRSLKTWDRDFLYC